MHGAIRRSGPTLLGLCCCLIFTASIAFAGEYNEVLNIGDPAPAWNDLPGVDGQPHSLADFSEKDFVVVVFTCNSCPIAVDYEDRIIALAKKYVGPGSKVGFVAINVNTIPEDRLDKMRERAESKGFPFPYLYDESQQIARDYGAGTTPEFFVLDRQRKIAYMGGLDNNSYPDMVTETYLEPALATLLAGKSPELTETVPRGCRIRYKRQRDR